MTAYANFKISINRQAADGNYPVTLARYDQDTDDLGQGLLVRNDVLPWALNAASKEEGEKLFNALFAGEEMKRGWAQAVSQSPDGRRIRLQIDPHAPELHAIPWELLREPARKVDAGATLVSRAHDLAAGVATPFSRFLNTGSPRIPPMQQGPIRVLVAIANPGDLHEYGSASLDVAAEANSLQAAFAQASGMEVEVTVLPQPCTLVNLEKELRKGYHVLHLLAHGALYKNTGNTALLLANAANKVEVTPDSEFVDMLAEHISQTPMNATRSLRLVFLANCYSGHRDPHNAFLGIAPQLVLEGTPAVLAMRQSVTMATARDFAKTFYQRLLAHGIVDLAANEARRSLITAKQTSMAIPALYMRLQDGLLFEVQQQAQARRAQPAQTPLRQPTNPILPVQVMVAMDKETLIIELGKLLRSESFTYEDLSDILTPNLGYRTSRLVGISASQARLANVLLEQARADGKLEQLVTEIVRMKPYLAEEIDRLLS